MSGTPNGPDPDALLRWGATRLRDLPWRRTSDPWAVLASEVMSQQTQVARVVPKWTEFMERWPTPGALADEPLADFLRFWEGLGYPRAGAHAERQNLRLAAQACVGEPWGEWCPRASTSCWPCPAWVRTRRGAVRAFAFRFDDGVVDTNIGRILARHRGERLTPRPAQLQADAWVPPGKGWEWNQTLMDLGATVCLPGVPACDACPVAATCGWRGSADRDDPAVRSAAVSVPQARFEGSNRQLRGRILRVLGAGVVARSQVAAAIGSPERARVDGLVADLMAEGLVEDGPDGVGLALD